MIDISNRRKLAELRASEIEETINHYIRKSHCKPFYLVQELLGYELRYPLEASILLPRNMKFEEKYKVPAPQLAITVEDTDGLNIIGSVQPKGKSFYGVVLWGINDPKLNGFVSVISVGYTNSPEEVSLTDYHERCHSARFLFTEVKPWELIQRIKEANGERKLVLAQDLIDDLLGSEISACYVSCKEDGGYLDIIGRVLLRKSLPRRIRLIGKLLKTSEDETKKLLDVASIENQITKSVETLKELDSEYSVDVVLQLILPLGLREAAELPVNYPFRKMKKK